MSGLAGREFYVYGFPGVDLATIYDGGNPFPAFFDKTNGFFAVAVGRGTAGGLDIGGVSAFVYAKQDGDNGLVEELFGVSHIVVDEAFPGHLASGECGGDLTIFLCVGGCILFSSGVRRLGKGGQRDGP